MAMSMDRYLAIRHPMVFRQVFNKRVARCVIIVIWLVASLLFIPCLYVRTTDQLPLPADFPPFPRTFCYEKWSNHWTRRVYNVVLFISIYAAPCLMILTAYISMGCKLCSPSVINNREGGDIILDRDSRLLRSRRRVARTLLVLAIVFTFCWMPYNLLLLGEDENFFSEKELIRKVMPFTLLLAHINSAANPLLYCFFSRNLRQCLWNLLRARRQNRRQSSEPLPPSDPRCRLSRIQSPACYSNNRAARAVHRRVSADLEKGSVVTPSSSKKHENESTPTTTLLPLQTASSITPVPVHHHSSAVV